MYFSYRLSGKIVNLSGYINVLESLQRKKTYLSQLYMRSKNILPTFVKNPQPKWLCQCTSKTNNGKKYIIFPLFFLSIQKKCIFVIEEKIKKDKKSSLYIYK
jgi:hypothetical protein